MARLPHVRLQRFLILSSLLLLAACSSGEHPQTTFEPVSEYGRVLNSLFANTFWWTIGVLVLVEALILYIAYRFREVPGAPKPKQIHGDVKLEFLWTVIPAVIVLFIAIPTIQTIFETQREPPEGALTVEVIGHQWWWEFRYAEYNVVTANELVLPVGRPINLKMHSADVIHSYWVPKVGGKRDVNPVPRPARGEPPHIVNYIGFTVDSVGYYLGQCAEYCGASHAIMRTAIKSLPPAEFAQWVTSMGGAQRTPPSTASVVPPSTAPGQPGEPRDTLSARDTIGASRQAAVPATAQGPLQGPATPAGAQTEEDRGRQILTTKVCIACHTIHGTSAKGVLGPNLTRFGSRRYIGAGARLNTLENVIAWIEHPAGVKPGALMPGTREMGGGMPPSGLTPEEVRAVAVYLLSLK